MPVLPANRENMFLTPIDHGNYDFHLLRFQVRECISAPYHAVVDVVCDDPTIDLSQLSGKPYTISLINDADEVERYVHGIASQSALVRHDPHYSIYQLVLVPAMQLLAWRSGSKIFQHMSLPDIIKAVLDQAGISGDKVRWVLQNDHPVRDYCVQYQETELAFIQRLMAEEGMFYYFEHFEKQHVLVIADGQAVHQDVIGSAEIPFRQHAGLVPDHSTVYEFQFGSRLRSGKASRRAFDFHKPSLALHSEHSDDWSHLEIYQYPGGYTDPAVGDLRSQHQWEAQQHDRKVARVASNVMRMTPGYRFNLVEHNKDDLNQGYLILSVEHRGEQPQVLQETDNEQGSQYHNRMIAIPESIPYRTPELPKPVIDGIQTAIVTGPAGEEIYTNEHSQIKLQFHWDREGQYDENSSCWIRVSQPYAGAGWGGVMIPRIGTEVVVRYMHGDPDQPIVIGQLYNGENRTPYALPDHKTRSTLKTNSSLGGKGYNEIRFEDLKNKEQIYIHAQKDYDLRVKNDHREWVGNTRHRIVVKDQYSHIQGDKHTTVDGDHNERVGADISIKAGQDRQDKTGGRWAHEAGKEIHFKAGNKVVINAGSELTIKAGSGFIKLDGGGVTVVGSLIRLNEGGAAGAGSGAAPRVPIQAIEAAMARAAKAPPPLPEQAKKYAPDAPTRSVDTTPLDDHWIELTLHDQDGNVLANEPFLITLPNGISRKETSDAHGHFRLERIPGGQCEISLLQRQKVLPGGSPDPAILSGPQPKPKKISKLRWLQDRVPVGEPATLEFYYQGFEGAEAVTVCVYEYDADGTHDDVGKVDVTLQQGFGRQTVEWTRSEAEIQKDLLDDEGDEPSPLSYFFEIVQDGVVIVRSDVNAPLFITVTFSLKPMINDQTLADGEIIRIDTYDGILEAEVKNGEAVFEHVPAGYFRVWTNTDSEEI